MVDIILNLYHILDADYFFFVGVIVTTVSLDTFNLKWLPSFYIYFNFKWLALF